MEYITPHRPSHNIEIDGYLPNAENPLNEMAANPNPERLPVITEENEAFDLDNEEISTPRREDNSLQERPIKVKELPTLVTP